MLGVVKFPRDWKSAWTEVGGKLYYERMVARKDDPVWAKLSDFGFSFPPFSFDPVAWRQDIKAEDAEFLGVVDIGTPVKPPAPTRKFDLIGILDQKN
jgi:hypothetical protein